MSVYLIQWEEKKMLNFNFLNNLQHWGNALAKVEHEMKHKHDDFRQAFKQMGRENQFSYEGLKTLFEMLEDYEHGSDQEIELDVIALCCDFTEYDSIEEIKGSYECINSEDDLAEHTWVVYQPSSAVVTLEKDKRRFEVAVSGGISTNNAAARTAFVEAGHGLAKIPVYDALPRIKAGLLRTILDDYKTADIELYGVFPPGAAGSKKLRVLLDYLKDYFTNQVATMTI